MFSQHTGMAGKYRCQKIGADGLENLDTGWFDNLITNQGLDQIGAPSTGLNTVAGVGTSNTAPAFSDTALVSPVSLVGGSVIQQTFVDGAAPYHSYVWQYTFAPGAATGNLSEVGVGPTSSGLALAVFSRALITDSAGNPVTITVLSDETFIVTYELRLYIDITDKPFSFAVNGVTYSGTYRRASITGIPNGTIPVGHRNNGTSFTAELHVIDNLQPLRNESFPNNLGAAANDATATYIAGTYYSEVTLIYDVSLGVAVGGFNFILFSSNHGKWQFSFSPNIQKTNTQQFSLTMRSSWGRYIP